MSDKLPNAEMGTIKIEKIIDYLLSDTHPVGRSKARFFKSYGFSSSDPQEFIDEIRKHAIAFAIEETAESEFGIKYAITGSIISPDGRNPTVRAIWIIELGSTIPNFVTLYPI